MLEPNTLLVNEIRDSRIESSGVLNPDKLEDSKVVLKVPNFRICFEKQFPSGLRSSSLKMVSVEELLNHLSPQAGKRSYELIRFHLIRN